MKGCTKPRCFAYVNAQKTFAEIATVQKPRHQRDIMENTGRYIYGRDYLNQIL